MIRFLAMKLFLASGFFSFAVAESAETTKRLLFPAAYQHRWGYVDSNFNWVINPQFGQASPFNGDLARVNIMPTGEPPFSGANYAFINLKGQVVISPKFEEVDSFSEGLAAALGSMSLNSPVPKAFGYIDQTGNWHIPPKFWTAGPFSEGIAPVQTQPAQFGYIDHDGQLVITDSFSNASPFSDSLAAAARSQGQDNNELWGYIKRDGTYFIQPQFQKARSFKEGLAAVQTKDAQQKTLWKIITPKEEFVASCDAEDIEEFSEGLVAAKLNGRWGYIDRNGKWAIPPRFIYVSSFTSGRALVCETESTFYFIDKFGKELWRPAAP